MTQKYKHPNLPKLSKQGLYDPTFEHDACGVGLVANIDGHRSHKIVNQGLEALCHLVHRGAAGADPETGDGAGITIQIPDSLFRFEANQSNYVLPDEGDYGLGMIFMPQGEDETKLCKSLIEIEARKEGFTVLHWRQVPTDPSKIGVLANKARPSIYQCFITREKFNKSDLETNLFILRRQIEKAIECSNIANQEEFYICSLSTSTVVYKGLLIADQLEGFYLDLKNENTESAFALVHSRFSTNTLGSWRLAHPYRYIIHNGEINTVRGNINWMAAREPSFASENTSLQLDKITPIMKEGESDTASLDHALEVLMASGRSIEHSMMMLIPEAWGDHIPMDKSKKDFYEYHSSLMEPWDGPALVIGTDGKKICAVLDRNGLRPGRYLVTTDGLLIMGSETGVIDIPPENILYKERIYPGRMFLLDLEKGQITNDQELKSQLSNQKPYGEWLDEHRIFLEDLPFSKEVETHKKDLVAQQKAFGYTLEDLRIIMEPMAATAYEPTGSMGNDAPLAFLSDENPLIFNYFKQLFAQVSNPPLDAIREELVTSLRSTIGEEKNLFAETPEHCRQITVRKPILNNDDMQRIKQSELPGIKSWTINIHYDPNEENPIQKAMDRVRKEASNAVNDG